MYDRDHHRSVRNLIEMLGEEESLRLGFLDRDDNETLILSPMGMGYLLDVVAGEIGTPHEAYAAGYTQGCDQFGHWMPQKTMDRNLQPIVFSPDDIAMLREVVTVVHDNYDVIDPLVLDSSPERLLTFRERLDEAEAVAEGRAVLLAATDLIHLNMAVMMAADCYEDLPLRKKGVSEADLEALTERITALEDRHFPHLRGAGISPRRP